MLSVRWQDQPDQRTVQSEIESALKKISGKLTRIIGSGRTDSGVHALAQVAHFEIERDILPDKIRLALNSILNKDVVIFNHYCVYKIFYFYFILLLLPLITIFSKGPNTVYILSSYVISSVSVLGMVFLLLTLVI